MSENLHPLGITVRWDSEGVPLEGPPGRPDEVGADAVVLLRIYEEGMRRHVTGFHLRGTRDAAKPTEPFTAEDLYHAWICFTGMVARDLPPGKEQIFTQAVLQHLQLTPQMEGLTSSEEASRPAASSPAAPSTPEGSGGA